MRDLNQKIKLRILILLLFTIIAVIYLGGICITEEMIRGSFLQAKKPPGREYLFGTDALGRDLFLRTLKGLGTSITIGLTASLISGFLALLVGIASAVGSKKIDGVLSWIIDLVMGVPHTILIILISFALGRGMKGLLVGVAATHWCSLARVIRAEVLQLRSCPFVSVSQKLGKSKSWIFTNHLLPHLLPQFLVGLILMFPHAILHEASISFLGFGLPPEEAAIGIILAESMGYLSTGMWWMVVLPGGTLVLLVLLMDGLAEAVSRLLDPYSAQE